MVEITQKEYDEYIDLKRRVEIEEYAQNFWEEYTNIIFKEYFEATKVPIVFSEKYILNKKTNGITSGVCEYYRWNKSPVAMCYVLVTINKELSIEDIKATIRHELIHFSLKVSNLKNNDNCAIFKILCDLFNGGFYGKLDCLESDIYDISYPAFNNVMSNFTFDQIATSLGISLNLSMLLTEIGNIKYDSESKLKELRIGTEVISEAININLKKIL